MSEWTIGAVFDAVAAAVPNRLMTVCGERRTTFAEGAERTRRLANFLAGRGLGARRERAGLDNWECGQDRIALIMDNDLYPDMVIGCLKARVVPANVNHYYTPHEIRDLLDYLRPSGVIYHRSLGAKYAEVLPSGRDALLVSVDDGSGAAQLPGSVSLDDALAQGDRDRGVAATPDDLIMICTGGTTGRPKGVLWRQGDVYVASMNGADHASVDEIHARVRQAGSPWFALSPLMHAAGIWTAFLAILNGDTAVLYDTRSRFDARSALRTAEREKAGVMTMVGDAYAARLVAELGRRSYDLSSLYAIATGGAATNPRYQAALLECLPQTVLINGYGSSETGSMGLAFSRDSRSETFALQQGGLLISRDYRRVLRPGDHELGWVAREGRIPLGYFDDADATRRTFPQVEGRRVVVSGDRARLEADGTLRLYGRDSLVVNTGGEKVFVEEVEEVLRAHPNVTDALVVGRPSDRWGEEVTALIAVDGRIEAVGEALRAFCAARLARFKIPAEFIVVDAIRRLGNGKADYRWAKRRAAR